MTPVGGPSMADRCQSCGSEVRGRICHFCGSVVGRIETPEAEAEAIQELHVAISEARDDKARARLISGGPLPDDRDVLLDAALRATQLLDPKNYSYETPHAALRRIEAVASKLRVLAPGDDVAQRGVNELEKRLSEFQAAVAREEQAGNKAVFGILVVAVALLAAVAYGTWRLLTG